MGKKRKEKKILPFLIGITLHSNQSTTTKREKMDQWEKRSRKYKKHGGKLSEKKTWPKSLEGVSVTNLSCIMNWSA